MIIVLIYIINTSGNDDIACQIMELASLSGILRGATGG